MTKKMTTISICFSKSNGCEDKPAIAFFVDRPLIYYLNLVLLAGLVFLCGCQTSTQSLFTVTGPGWHVQQGQALWRPKNGLPEFGGDLVLASDDTGRSLIQFDKTPMAILSAQTTSNRWLIKFPQKQWSFSGHGNAPLRFSWLYLPAALNGKPLPKQLHFETKADGGWRLENSRTGETLEGFLSP
jgi:hypothetical protein